MLVVILGAGASYDSSPISPVTPGALMVTRDRPPLTVDLFNQNREQFHFLERYGPTQAVVRTIQRRLVESGNLERILGEFQVESDIYQPRLSQLMGIRFYLGDFLADCSEAWWQRHHGVTTYAEFVDEINRHSRAHGEEVCYVTFNYDTLLDQTLQAQGLRDLMWIDGYVAEGGPLYIKVHGSVNWRRQTGVTPGEGIRGPSQVVERAVQIQQADSLDHYMVVPHDQPSWTIRWEGSNADYLAVPALAIPVERKTERNFEMPAAHREALEKALARASRFLVIGWRGSEEHFNEILKTHNQGLNVPFTVVCGEGRAGETVENLAALGFENFTDASCGFTDFVEHGHLRDYLRA